MYYLIPPKTTRYYKFDLKTSKSVIIGQLNKFVFMMFGTTIPQTIQISRDRSAIEFKEKTIFDALI